MEVFWYLTTHGDGRYLGTSIGGRTTDAHYLHQVAHAVDGLGYAGILLPTGRFCDDAWLVAASLLNVTRQLRFLVAIRPGLMSPSLAARMAATFDRLSGGRLLINVVTGGDPSELAGDGLHLDHDERYELTGEFLQVWRELLSGETVDFKGEHLDIRSGTVVLPGVQQPYPALYFGGSSPAAHAIAARHVDVYLSWGEPPEQVAEKIAVVRELAARESRTLRFGIRMHVIVRETEQEAWDAANALIKHVDQRTIDNAKQAFSRMDSEGQRRMLALHNGSRASLEISPNLWAGVGLVRGGAGTALVGDPETVAERMREYAALGIDTFIFSGYPHLEEAYRVAELLFPLLPLTHPGQQASGHGPAGELMALNHYPRSAERGQLTSIGIEPARG